MRIMSNFGYLPIGLLELAHDGTRRGPRTLTTKVTKPCC